jgi:hypothetical protein
MPPSLPPTNITTTDAHAAYVKSLFESISKEKDLLTSLPAAFYQSPQIYELERRAIFSKSWFLVSHRARYRNVGDYVQYEMAGFNFVVFKNKDEKIVGWHNVCRCVLSLLLNSTPPYLFRKQVPQRTTLTYDNPRSVDTMPSPSSTKIPATRESSPANTTAGATLFQAN